MFVIKNERSKFYFMIIILSAGVFGYASEICKFVEDDFYTSSIACPDRMKGLIAVAVITCVFGIAVFGLSLAPNVNKLVEAGILLVMFITNSASAGLSNTIKNITGIYVRELCWTAELLIIYSFFNIFSKENDIAVEEKPVVTEPTSYTAQPITPNVAPTQVPVSQPPMQQVPQPMYNAVPTSVPDVAGA